MVPTSISKNGTAKCIISINELSMDHHNKKFVILFSVFQEDNITKAVSSAIPYIKPVISPPLLCVTHRLVIEEENREPFIWFKDEGGREKCIDLKIVLKDHNNQIVRNRKVKLKVTLCYFGGAIVNAQDLLTLSSDSRLMIEDHNSNVQIAGETQIKYRINEVSKTHQSQPFCVYISPDTSFSPLFGDIAPAYSVPVEIRSKRNNPNKRPRESKQADELSSSEHFNHRVVKPITQMNPINNISTTTITNTNSISSASTSTTGLNTLNNIHKKQKSQNHLHEYTPQDEYVVVIDNVVKWTNRVVEGLQEIQWRPAGYNNGDPSQVLYNIVNPNDIIKKI